MQSTERSIALPEHAALSKLARDNPSAFDALRGLLIEECISRAPELNQPRLRGFQFRVDAIRCLSKSPLGATVKIYELMWDRFLTMNQNLQEFTRCTQRPALTLRDVSSIAVAPVKSDSTKAAAKCDARIIEFRPRQPAPPPIPGVMKKVQG